MDNLLVPACILLALTNLAFALLGLYWKHKAKVSEHAAMEMALELSRVARDTSAATWRACKRHMLGMLYRVVAKAEREGRDTWAALREVAAQAKAEEDESVVQVPQEV